MFSHTVTGKFVKDVKAITKHAPEKWFLKLREAVYGEKLLADEKMRTKINFKKEPP